jgi:hypothetical protein
MSVPGEPLARPPLGFLGGITKRVKLKSVPRGKRNRGLPETRVSDNEKVAKQFVSQMQDTYKKEKGLDHSIWTGGVKIPAIIREDRTKPLHKYIESVIIEFSVKSGETVSRDDLAAEFNKDGEFNPRDALLRDKDILERQHTLQNNEEAALRQRQKTRGQLGQNELIAFKGLERKEEERKSELNMLKKKHQAIRTFFELNKNHFEGRKETMFDLLTEMESYENEICESDQLELMELKKKNNSSTYKGKRAENPKYRSFTREQLLQYMMSSLYSTEKGDWFTLDWYKKMRRTSDKLKYRADPIDVARIANARLEATIAKQRIEYKKLKRNVNGASALFDAKVLEQIKVSSREVHSIEDKTEQSTKSRPSSGTC